MGAIETARASAEGELSSFSCLVAVSPSLAETSMRSGEARCESTA
jgi:hypothetical protein